MGSKIFRGRNIVAGITGGIACYKTLDIIKELRKLGADIHVIMTEHSTHLAGIKEFEKTLGNEVHTDLFHPKIDYIGYIKKNKEIKHISLADIADLFLICPATANIIGKIANGIADDLLTTSVMATNAPVLICPAMNVKMWKNRIVQENVAKLRKLNYHFAEPEYGELACGYKGVGRLANPEAILGSFLRGADVLLLRGENSIEPGYNIEEERFSTVDDLFNKIKNKIRDFDIVIHCAAVSDFAVESRYDKKIRSDQKLHLELAPTTKIFEKLKKLNNKIFLVGFKAECNVSGKILADRAYGLLKNADADLVVANDVGRKNAGFNAEKNEVIVVDRNRKSEHIGLADKRVVADRILDLLGGKK
ncbi:hypothetical protein HYX09_01575 [Candidatus Woesearchaeota archaeon]|nr:hypothetical protein [Candidatus Woesearchaeota archaeon]